jgi:hypothetical protein
MRKYRYKVLLDVRALVEVEVEAPHKDAAIAAATLRLTEPDLEDHAKVMEALDTFNVRNVVKVA